MLTKNVGVGVLKVCKGLVGMIESGKNLSMDVDGCRWMLQGGGM